MIHYKDWSLIQLKHLAIAPLLVEEPPLERGKFGYDKNGRMENLSEEGQVPNSLARYNHPKYKKLYKGVQSKIDNGAWTNISVDIYVAGTHGTSYQSGNNWANVPFRYIDTSALSGFPATRFYGSDSHQNSGWITGKALLVHYTVPNIGAITRYQYSSNNNTNINMSGAWTVSVTT